MKISDLKLKRFHIVLYNSKQKLYLKYYFFLTKKSEDFNAKIKVAENRLKQNDCELKEKQQKITEFEENYSKSQK